MPDYSRALLFGERITAAAGDLRSQLENSNIAVGVDSSLPGALPTLRILLQTLRRLPGVLWLERSTLDCATIEGLTKETQDIDPSNPIRVVDVVPDFATVRVAVSARTRDRWIRVVPDRYGVHIARRHDVQIIPSGQLVTGLATVLAAAFAAAEVFKDVALVRCERRANHDYLCFCPVTLSGDLVAAPGLCGPLTYDGALVGLGAVGSAIALILAEMKAQGRAVLVDRQRYSAENKTTYSLGTAGDVTSRTWKTEVAARRLSNIRCKKFNGDVADFVMEVDRSHYDPPHLVLSALDSVEARHDVQRLWPDRLIDAATGDTMLGLHDVAGEGAPCLICFLPPRRGASSSLFALSDQTGLDVATLARGDDLLREEDLESVKSEYGDKLRQHVGKPICGLAAALGLTEVPSNGFQPAIPFVAMQAACLAVGRLIAIQLGLNDLPNFVQYDALIGPQNVTLEKRAAMSGCYCQQRAATIREVRKQRFGPRMA